MTIEETCPCGATIKVDDCSVEDEKGYPHATRVINTWRKYHYHGTRTDDPADRPESPPE
jgi:hypothetical protein